MRVQAFLSCIALTLSVVHADPLSSADREALLDTLEKLRANADSRVDARFRVALAAYRDAMGNEQDAMNFYLKCLEKVDFEDKEKSGVDFREWKRKQAERFSSPGFKLALRYQLSWLSLSLRSASENADRSAIATEAMGIVDSIFRDAAKLDEQGQLLNQSVTSTVFARAYEIGSIEDAKLPEAPLQIEAFFEKIVFPPLRSALRVDSLRGAWIKRIQLEGVRIENWGGEESNGKSKRNGTKSLDYARFAAETLPELQWDMEMDLFRSGDEAASAMRMLAHIEKYITHKSARNWGEELESLLMGEEAETPTTTANE